MKCTDRRLKEIQEQVNALADEAEQLILSEVTRIARRRKLLVKNLYTLTMTTPSGKEVEDVRVSHLVMNAYREIFRNDLNDFIIDGGSYES